MLNDKELSVGEPHPAARDALAWLAKKPITELYIAQEAFSSCAIEGNRLASICAETLRRFLVGEPISDRYLLGLVWTLRGKNETVD